MQNIDFLCCEGDTVWSWLQTPEISDCDSFYIVYKYKKYPCVDKSILHDLEKF